MSNQNRLLERIDKIELQLGGELYANKRKEDIMKIFKAICIRNSSANATAPVSKIMSIAKELYNDL